MKRLLIATSLAVLTSLFSMHAQATTNQKKSTVQKSKPSVVKTHVRRQVVKAAPSIPSFGQKAGLHATNDILDLKSSVAYVIDQDTHEVLLSKNDQAVLPIASITKLMTGLIVSEAKLPMDESITITQDDVDTEKGSSSRLRVGSTLTRGELLHLALMASENRAAHALGRTYPGGMPTFVGLMNAKAAQLGMRDTRYVEPTGLSSKNQSSAKDLATLVGNAYHDATLRELSTSPSHSVEVGNRTLQYNTTNRLVKNPNWDIGLQKTGYISEARQYGVARDNEELELGVRCMASGIYDDQGKLVAGLSISAPADRLDEGWLPKLQATTQAISHALGYKETSL